MKFFSLARRLLRSFRLIFNEEIIRKLGVQLTELRLLQDVRAHNPGCFVDDGVIVGGWPNGGVVLGPGTRIEQGTVIALGDELNGWGRLEIGSNTWIGQYNNFRLASNATISVGSNCLISQFCSLVASNHETSGRHLIKLRPPDSRKLGVCIGNGVWLGAGCAILPGVTVGEGAVIGANSVVVTDVPAFEIWGGIPAKRIGVRSEEAAV